MVEFMDPGKEVPGFPARVSLNELTMVIVFPEVLQVSLIDLKGRKMATLIFGLILNSE